ncbi:MAG: 4-(cytidine 5'-diphospho)-2-C-methyl-D-erythritol kinase [Alphaproteobacteria bacterium]|nr:4-(cytidine 5'-diphospho)-2-C-methyl-D-erythritol kinase [Alphaproteobacteria bacterium]
MSLAIEAPAKVNLSLRVVGRRDDGYHLLDSLVVFAGVGDSLSFAPADALSLTVGGPAAGELPAAADNVVLKAARALADLAGIPPRAAILLTKRLPVASGIGGGSTDAAATLLGLSRLWNLDVPLDALGLALGADLPVCLRRRPTLLSGIGEALADAPPLPPAWLVLANPRVPLSTPMVFRARSGAFSKPAPFAAAPADARALAEALAPLGNDLTDAAISLAPMVATALTDLAGLPGCLLSRMSGSGATCFGLFATQDEANAAAKALSTRRPGWWVAAAPILS